MPSIPRIWLEAPRSPVEAGRLVDAYDLPPAIAEVMVRRGLTEEDQIEAFLDPRLNHLSDPFLLPDMDKAVPRIWQAIERGETILVFGDYDVDGVTSTAFLTRVLEGLGAKVKWFIPHRIEDGYGLGAETLQHCLDTHHPNLIVTVDCGTGSVDAVNIARQAGVDVIVTDHHEASGEVVEAYALVNPKTGTDQELLNLAGVGVAFKLSHALIKYGRQQNFPSSFKMDMRPLMYLVALGTVADMVPLVGENRILARFGIDVLNKRPDPGIDALVRNAGVQQEMSSYHIGFVLGPRINAAGRMDSPDMALNMLLSDSPADADRMARSLEDANKKRQAIEEKIRLEAEAMMQADHNPDEPGVIVVAKRGWHSGVVGIVASRLVRRYHRPAIVISIDPEDGIGRGSCRSIEGFDLIQQLQSVDHLLQQYGGHRMAAGLDVREEDIPAFRKEINARAVEVMANTELRPIQPIDGWLGLEEVTREFLNAQDRLMPFGHANPVPVWAIKNIHIEKFQKVGKDKKHLRILFRTPQGMQDAIGFGLGERTIPDGPLDIAFQLRRNVFRGEERLQLMLQDIRAS
jgi:single-stranded-DNA-specific exonuclease